MTVVRIGRLDKALPLVVAAAVLGTLFAGTALAQAQEAEQPAANLSNAQVLRLWDQLQSSPVSRESCAACHNNLDVAQSKVPKEIIFSHGIHLGNYDCAACHSEFPHSAARQEIILRPKMIECFACHGLRHGPMGQIAYNTCDKCHRTPQDRLRPAFHVYDWKNKPHVKPALDELQTRCMMCHDGPFCDECHASEFVRWEPEVPYIFDPGAEGCSQCHKSSVPLQRMGLEGEKSFQVTAVQASVHSQVSCIQCHVDFKYTDGENATADWAVNAGLACQNCHAKQKEARLKQPVADYKASIHWLGKDRKTGLANRDFTSPSCASCHGGHDIALETSLTIKFAALDTCAQTDCHADKYATYDDYYHGRAYKEGNADSPACWDCHEAHKTLPKSDPKSAVSPKNAVDTCGQEGCHDSDRSKPNFVEKAGSLIHEKQTVYNNNWFVRTFRDLWPG